MTHGRGHAKRNDEPSASSSTMGDVESTKSTGSMGEHDAVGRAVRTSDAQPEARQSTGVSVGFSAPTMRSRVTVVCAECKKQKLRCDRRIPCESCVKRNTVSRCIYTPAAIEKVDVTSINNRLRVVEGSLSALGLPTHGYQHQLAVQPQIVMQQMQNSLSSFPSLGGAGVAFSGGKSISSVNQGSRGIAQSSIGNGHYGRNASTPRVLAMTNDTRCATTIAPLDGTAALWIREITKETEQATSMPPSPEDTRRSTLFPRSATGNMVSSNSLGLDLQPINRETTNGVAVFGLEGVRHLDVRQLLALHAGLGMSSSYARGTERDSVSGTEALDPVPRAYATLAKQLLAQFPPPRSRREMLVRLGISNLTEGMSCVPFRTFCAGIESICSSISGETIEDASVSAQVPVPSFSAIAEAAAALALGALLWAIEPSSGMSSSDEALKSLLTRSMEPLAASATSGMPSFRADSHGAEDGKENVEKPDVILAYSLHRLADQALAMHRARHGHAAHDIPFIHARILSARYLLLAHSNTLDFSDAVLPPELPSLVGSLVWEARVMGLDNDPDEFDALDDVRSSTTGTLLGGVHGVSVSVKLEEGNENAENRSKGKGMSLFMKEVRRRLWWWVVLLDLLVSDAYGYNATILSDEHSTRIPSNVDDTCFCPDSTVLASPDDSSPERNNSFYTTKLRLLEMRKHLPARLFRSGLVPTAECHDEVAATAAQKLAAEILAWLDELPERYRLDAADDDPSSTTFPQPPMVPLRSPSAEKSERSALRTLLIVQRCDLAFCAYHTLMWLFTPRLFNPSRRGASSSDKVMPADRQFAGLKAIEPALVVVRAAQMQMTEVPDAPRGTIHMHDFPRRLFDAAAVLAYNAIQQPLYTSTVVIEAVRTALDILSRALKRGNRQGDSDMVENTEAERVIEMLLKRAENAKMRNAPITAGVKRKHEEIDIETDQLEARTREARANASVPSGAVPASSTPSTSVYTRLTTFPRDKGLYQQQSTMVPAHRGRNVPAVAMRQRLRNRRDDISGPETSQTSSTLAESSLRVPSSCSTPFQLPPNHRQQAFAAGPSVSPSPSAFTSEMTSTSPISPLHQYMSSEASGSVYNVPSTSFREAAPMGPDNRPTLVTPVQEPSPPPSYQYPVPSLTVPSYRVPLPLQQHQGQHAPGIGDVDISYNAGATYPDSTSQQATGSDVTDDAGSWAPANFNEGLNIQPQHSTRVYPSVQHSQGNPPREWSADGTTSSGILPSSWNMPSFTNWNHDAQ